MAIFDPSFTIGIEEEYLLVNLETLDLAEAPAGLMEECQAALQGAGHSGISGLSD